MSVRPRFTKPRAVRPPTRETLATGLASPHIPLAFTVRLGLRWGATSTAVSWSNLECTNGAGRRGKRNGRSPRTGAPAGRAEACPAGSAAPSFVPGLSGNWSSRCGAPIRDVVHGHETWTSTPSRRTRVLIVVSPPDRPSNKMAVGKNKRLSKGKKHVSLALVRRVGTWRCPPETTCYVPIRRGRTRADRALSLQGLEEEGSGPVPKEGLVRHPGAVLL